MKIFNSISLNYEKLSNIVKSAIWMGATLVSFSLIAVAVREVSNDIGIPEILFYRSSIGLFIIIIYLVITDLYVIKTKNFKLHLTRNIFHFLGQYAWIYGITMLTLSEVFALEFTVPIWTALIAVFFLNEKLTLTRILAIILGFIGIIIILKPSSCILNLASIVVISGAITYSISNVVTKEIIKNDSIISIIFYMTLTQMILAFIIIEGEPKLHSMTTFITLIIIGVVSILAHYCTSKALYYSDTVVVIPMGYLRLPIIMIVGFTLYDEIVDIVFMLGVCIMLIGILINILVEHKTQSNKQ